MIIPKIPKYRAYALYRLMYVFDKFCREHDIQYWIEGGTAIGAVRHGGLIPWDDDIDVHCTISDCKRLQTLVQELKQSNLVIRYEKSFGNLMKVCFNNGELISSDKPWSFPFIDVFCMRRVKRKDKDYYVYSAKEWRELLGGKIETSDIFPLQRVKFGATYVNAPKGIKKYLKENYGPKVLKEGYFQGFHSGRYKPGEREMIGKSFPIDGVGDAEPYYYPKVIRRSELLSKRRHERKLKTRSVSRRKSSLRSRRKSRSRSRRKSRSRSRRKSRSKSRRKSRIASRRR